MLSQANNVGRDLSQQRRHLGLKIPPEEPAAATLLAGGVSSSPERNSLCYRRFSVPVDGILSVGTISSVEHLILNRTLPKGYQNDGCLPLYRQLERQQVPSCFRCAAFVSGESKKESGEDVVERKKREVNAFPIHNINKQGRCG